MWLIWLFVATMAALLVLRWSMQSRDLRTRHQRYIEGVQAWREAKGRARW